MHRHAYAGRKLSLDRDERRALIRGQVTALVLHESLVTTEAKAKEIRPYFERMVTAAKKGGLANGRKLRAFILTENAVQKMIQEIAPAMVKRDGGYTRITKLGNRRGDNSPMAVISVIMPPAAAKKAEEAVEEVATKPAAEKKPKATKVASAKPTRKSRAPKTGAKEKEAAK
ncbi:MAG TPA: 50S ribosomal protein L17 [Candidatus Nanoarchaeia archaeon]|nr:50S ribosomal protein L17 [Candidatus Nanoarchaeia archaeon]